MNKNVAMLRLAILAGILGVIPCAMADGVMPYAMADEFSVWDVRFWNEDAKNLIFSLSLILGIVHCIMLFLSFLFRKRERVRAFARMEQVLMVGVFFFISGFIFACLKDVQLLELAWLLGCECLVNVGLALVSGAWFSPKEEALANEKMKKMMAGKTDISIGGVIVFLSVVYIYELMHHDIPVVIHLLSIVHLIMVFISFLFRKWERVRVYARMEHVLMTCVLFSSCVYLFVLENEGIAQGLELLCLLSNLSMLSGVWFHVPLKLNEKSTKIIEDIARGVCIVFFSVGYTMTFLMLWGLCLLP